MRLNKLDIFGQIDALVEKHDAAVLTDKPLQSDDFPKLTDVINKDSLPPSDVKAATTAFDEVSDKIDYMSEEDNIIFQVEEKVSRLFDRQQVKLEETIRRIIREELGKD